MYFSPEYTYVDIVEDYQRGLPYVLFFLRTCPLGIFFLICRIIQVFDYLVFIKAFVYFNVTENATENSSAFLRNT